MSERTPSTARGLCAEVARQAITEHHRRTGDIPAAGSPKADWRRYMASLDMTLFGHGLVTALTALRSVDPAAADQVAERISDDWDNPPGAFVTLLHHGTKLGVLDQHGNVLWDGVPVAPEQIRQEAGL